MSPLDLVVAFPGQGSLSPGVGAPWRDDPCFDVVAQVGEQTKTDLGTLLVDGDEESLVSTRNAQLATFALSLAILDAAGVQSRSRWMLGHSLGEYTALVAAGVLSRADGTALVDARGGAMLAAAAARPGGLVAMIGGDDHAVAQACAEIVDLYVANRNGPGQVVLGGSTDAVASLCDRAKELGFRRAIPLRVGGAFHTPLMAPAAPALRAALDAATFRAGTAAVVANVDGAVHDDPGAWSGLLARQLVEPVDWERSIRALPAGSTVVEFGPGGVLAGLIRRIRDDVTCVTVGVPDELDALKALA